MATGDVFKWVMLVENGRGQASVSGYHRVTTQATGDDELNAGLHDMVKTVIDAFRIHIPNTQTISCLGSSRVAPAGSIAISKTEYLTKPGTLTNTPAHPMNTALMFNLYAGRNGRASRRNVYWPSPPLAWFDNGHLVQSEAGLFTDLFRRLFHGLRTDALGNSWTPVCFSPPGTSGNITFWTADVRLRRMRRRSAILCAIRS